MDRHIRAVMLREGGVMCWRLLPLFVILAATAANADPAQDARSATAACLSAVIDGAPVEDVQDGPVSIRRGKDPVSCTVSVTDGEPVVVRDAVIAAINRRAELFRPTRTLWDPQGFASREAFCNLSLRRNLNVVVSTAKPGLQPVLVSTVFEAPRRDGRCDRDEGIQTLTEKEPLVSTSVPPVQELAPKPAKAKKRLIPRLPWAGRDKE